jgi:hypothetical protein
MGTASVALYDCGHIGAAGYYAELAAREDVPLGTMKSWIRRGLLRLKGCLER